MAEIKRVRTADIVEHVEYYRGQGIADFEAIERAVEDMLRVTETA